MEQLGTRTQAVKNREVPDLFQQHPAHIKSWLRVYISKKKTFSPVMSASLMDFVTVGFHSNDVCIFLTGASGLACNLNSYASLTQCQYGHSYS